MILSKKIQIIKICLTFIASHRMILHILLFHKSNILRCRIDNFLQLLTSDAMRVIQSYFLRELMSGQLIPKRSKRHYLTSAQ